MKSIFSKEDFLLCDVPVPDGYPQSQTHAGINMVSNDTYLLTTSPFPCRKKNIVRIYFRALLRKITGGILCKKKPYGEYYENPLLFIGKTINNNPPTKFAPYYANPLMGTPIDKYNLGSYCSDPDIYIEGHNVYILNRESVRTPYLTANGTNIELKINLIIGEFKNDNFILKEIKSKFDNQKELACSPCLTFHNSKYRYIYLVSNSYNTGAPCEKLVIRSDEAINGNFEETHNVEVDKGRYEPWHMSVFSYKDILYSIIACVKRGEKHRCYQMLGVFDKSLSKMKIYQKPLTDLKSYRGAACVREKDGLFILYSTTVHESFLGSKSIDGRDVILATIPFEELLNKL